MRKTAIQIDDELAEQARVILGTTTLTDTVNAALESVVARERQELLIQRLQTGKGLDLELMDEVEAKWR